MNAVKTILFFTLIVCINFSFLTKNKRIKNEAHQHVIEAFQNELCAHYEAGENIILTNQNGQQIVNPNKADLQRLDEALFTQNRIRVTLQSHSDNNLCSTEMVIKSKSGKIEANYSVNACTAYGWIFFTTADCFDVEVFHDAGLEAPYGSAVNGSVDWTFQFNNQSRIAGTYMDLGAANMFKVAHPCYDVSRIQPVSAMQAKQLLKAERKMSKE